MKVHIPIRLLSLPNTRMHWRTLDKLKRTQKAATAICLLGAKFPPMPVIVTITRIGPRKLDDDNLAAACKYVRDVIARRIGVDDGSDLYTWRYQQRKGEYGVDVEIVTRPTTDQA